MYSQVAPPDNLTQYDNKKLNEGLPEKPASISDVNWKKFQELKERRVKLSRHKSERKVKKRLRNKCNDESAASTGKRVKSEVLCKNINAWKEICSNIDVNSHLNPCHMSREKTKSKLEENLNAAIHDGDFTKAEMLSDQMSQEALAVKITDAIHMRDYRKEKDSQEQWKKYKKKKKLLWGFEQKERWESKGNM